VTALEGLHATNEGAYDSAWADLDLDGDQDLVEPTSGTYPERVFISDAANNGNHWLYIRLAGPTANTTAIGASLYATLHDGTPQERTLRREANTNAGTFNQSDLPVHFGLGAATVVDKLRIEWPDGTIQTLNDIPVDQYLTIEFPTGPAGDYNGDGAVDAADYTTWRNKLGENVALPNETVTLGSVTSEDYDQWRENFGAVSLPGSGASTSSMVYAAVPEPRSSLLMLGFAITSSLARLVRMRAIYRPR
jgi:hypothetical protein